jgi:hypothetical protein
VFGGNPETAFGFAVLAASLALAFYHADIASWYFRIR